MVQGRYIDQVLLRVNGGNLNDESSVQRDDIRAYLPTAINYVTAKAYYINIKEEGNRDFPSNFYGYVGNLAIDRSGTIPKITLPQMVVSLPSNQGVRNVMDDCGNTYTPLADQELSLINYYKDQMPDIRFYRRNNLDLALYNLPRLAQHLNAVVMVDPSQFTDTTEVPVQAGMETDVIDLCVQFFTGQRQQPSDLQVNKADLNAQ